MVVVFAIAATLAERVDAQDILSLCSPFADRDARVLTKVEGTWCIDSADGDTLSIKRVGDNFYSVRYVSARQPSLFEGMFGRVGDDIMLDLLPVVPDTMGNEYARKHLITAHTLFKMNIGTETLGLAPMNYRWFYDSVVTRKISLNYVWSENRLILTAPADTLKIFLVQHAKAAGFFEDNINLRRIATMGLADTIVTKPEAKRTAPVEERTHARQKCVPSFPMKDGWLGGDEDVSVPLSPTKTLWLFSDTFVGQQQQTSRSGARMVSNTIGISTCDRDGKSTIRYYWRDEYTAHPRPLFESFTTRYRYWVADAFMDGNILYVVLQKIGPKLHAAPPGDIFNFDGVGLSLAKIVNPNESDPDRWTIELIPWSHVISHDTWNGQLVKEAQYVYLFVDGKTNDTHLLRVPLDNIESPEGHVEYYAVGGVWKNGTEAHDMEIVMKGNPGQSVEYHAKLKQWIMICGPGFLSRDIRIRTAPELKGPWSEEEVVYQCPEQTPGSAVYDKDNFCYLGSQHMQFYDDRTSTMIITYNCSSAQFSKLVSNPTLYTPRVVSIQLKK